MGSQGLQQSRSRAGAAQPKHLAGKWRRAARVRLRSCVKGRLGVDGRLAKTLITSSSVESMIPEPPTATSPVGVTDRSCCAGSPRACSTPSDPTAASRATSRCRSSSLLCTAMLTPKPPKTPTLSVSPLRVHRGSSPKVHADRNTLLRSLPVTYYPHYPVTETIMIQRTTTNGIEQASSTRIHVEDKRLINCRTVEVNQGWEHSRDSFDCPQGRF